MEGLFQPTHLLFVLVLFPLVLIAVLYRVLKMVIRAARSNDRRQAPVSAEDIVRERYARGEINRTQFEQMVEDLRKTRSEP